MSANIIKYIDTLKENTIEYKMPTGFESKIKHESDIRHELFTFADYGLDNLTPEEQIYVCTHTFFDNNGFMALPISDWVVKNLNNKWTYSCQLPESNDKTLTICIYGQDSDANNIPDVISNFCFCIANVRRCYLHNDHEKRRRRDREAGHHMNISYYITPFEKYFPVTAQNHRYDEILNENGNLQVWNHHHTEIISKYQVNTGMTERGNGNITMWRTEEVYKVFLHELLHHYHFEQKLNLNVINQHQIIGSSNYIPSEPELPAELQTFILYQAFYNPDGSRLTPHSSISTRDRFIIEVDHAIDCAYHILSFYFNNDSNKIIINTNTSVLYYFIYRAIFLSQLYSDAIKESVLTLTYSGELIDLDVSLFIQKMKQYIKSRKIPSKHITMMSV
jgi:hypothetical protein